MEFETKLVKVRLAIQRFGESMYPAEKAVGAKALSKNKLGVFKKHENDRR